LLTGVVDVLAKLKTHLLTIFFLRLAAQGFSLLVIGYALFVRVERSSSATLVFFSFQRGPLREPGDWTMHAPTG